MKSSNGATRESNTVFYSPSKEFRKMKRKGDISGYNGSFYRFIRIPAIICFVHGTFPFKNVFSHRGEDIRFAYLSLHFAWGYVLYTVASVISMYCISARPQFIYMGVIYLVRTWIYFISSQVCNRFFIEFIRKSEQVEYKFWKYRKIRFDFDKRKYEYSYYACLAACYAFNIATQAMSIFAFSKRFSMNYALLVSVSVIYTMPRLLSPLLFIVTLHILKLRFLAVDSELARSLESNEPIRESDIEVLRLLYGELCVCADLLLDWCSLRILICLGFLTLETILISYRCTVVFGRFSLTGDLPNTLACIGLIYAISSSSELLLASSKAVLGSMRRIPLTSLSLRNQKQFRIWMIQMTAVPIQISISDLFKVNRHLITVILSAIATYVTVIIQLEPQLDFLDKKFKGMQNLFSSKNTIINSTKSS
ncbi:unnamed protein product [Bemisia tabaci]|uniref:Gustatory receptor n=1 Tax=Bemisia tabaci TaxID=7038 RepID=A0A9P0AL46_BEMTA|nr:unnamed protein product [Bemisia tabaci]